MNQGLRKTFLHLSLALTCISIPTFMLGMDEPMQISEKEKENKYLSALNQMNTLALTGNLNDGSTIHTITLIDDNQNGKKADECVIMQSSFKELIEARAAHGEPYIIARVRTKDETALQEAITKFNEAEIKYRDAAQLLSEEDDEELREELEKIVTSELQKAKNELEKKKKEYNESTNYCFHYFDAHALNTFIFSELRQKSDFHDSDVSHPIILDSEYPLDPTLADQYLVLANRNALFLGYREINDENEDNLYEDLTDIRIKNPCNRQPIAEDDIQYFVYNPKVPTAQCRFLCSYRQLFELRNLLYFCMNQTTNRALQNYAYAHAHYNWMHNDLVTQDSSTYLNNVLADENRGMIGDWAALLNARTTMRPRKNSGRHDASSLSRGIEMLDTVLKATSQKAIIREASFLRAQSLMQLIEEFPTYGALSEQHSAELRKERRKKAFCDYQSAVNNGLSGNDKIIALLRITKAAKDKQKCARQTHDYMQKYTEKHPHSLITIITRADVLMQYAHYVQLPNDPKAAEKTLDDALELRPAKKMSYKIESLLAHLYTNELLHYTPEEHFTKALETYEILIQDYDAFQFNNQLCAGVLLCTGTSKIPPNYAKGRIYLQNAFAHQSKTDESSHYSAACYFLGKIFAKGLGGANQHLDHARKYFEDAIANFSSTQETRLKFKQSEESVYTLAHLELAKLDMGETQLKCKQSEASFDDDADSAMKDAHAAHTHARNECEAAKSHLDQVIKSSNDLKTTSIAHFLYGKLCLRSNKDHQYAIAHFKAVDKNTTPYEHYESLNYLAHLYAAAIKEHSTQERVKNLEDIQEQLKDHHHNPERILKRKHPDAEQKPRKRWRQTTLAASSNAPFTVTLSQEAPSGEQPLAITHGSLQDGDVDMPQAAPHSLTINN